MAGDPRPPGPTPADLPSPAEAGFAKAGGLRPAGGGCRGRRQAEPPWLIIRRDGSVDPVRFKARGTAIRQADKCYRDYKQWLMVKHDRTGERWERRRGSWFKIKDRKHG